MDEPETGGFNMFMNFYFSSGDMTTLSSDIEEKNRMRSHVGRHEEADYIVLSILEEADRGLRRSELVRTAEEVLGMLEKDDKIDMEDSSDIGVYRDMAHYVGVGEDGFGAIITELTGRFIERTGLDYMATNPTDDEMYGLDLDGDYRDRVESMVEEALTP